MNFRTANATLATFHRSLTDDLIQSPSRTDLAAAAKATSWALSRRESFSPRFQAAIDGMDGLCNAFGLYSLTSAS